MGSAHVDAAFGPNRASFSVPLEVISPVDMDGSYSVLLDLRSTGSKVRGTGVLSLSGGTECPLSVRGRMKRRDTVLRIRGNRRVNPAFSGIRLRVRTTPLEDGSAHLHAISGRAFGQTIAWP